jgi:hypothetical protein
VAPTDRRAADALLELGRRLVAERDPAALIAAACAAVREMTGARVASIAVTHPNGGIDRLIVDPPSTPPDAVPPLDAAGRGRIAARQTIRAPSVTHPDNPRAATIVLPVATPR